MSPIIRGHPNIQELGYMNPDFASQSGKTNRIQSSARTMWLRSVAQTDLLHMRQGKSVIPVAKAVLKMYDHPLSSFFI